MPESIMILVMSMLHRREVTLESSHGIVMTGIVNSIQAEDGSGTSFNVRLSSELTCYLKRPVGMGTAKDPIRSHKNVEEVRELFSNFQ